VINSIRQSQAFPYKALYSGCVKFFAARRDLTYLTVSPNLVWRGPEPIERTRVRMLESLQGSPARACLAAFAGHYSTTIIANQQDARATSFRCPHFALLTALDTGDIVAQRASAGR